MRIILVLFLTLLFSAQCTSITLAESTPSGITDIKLTPIRVPALAGDKEVVLYLLNIYFQEGTEKTILKNIAVNFTQDSQTDCISSLKIYQAGAPGMVFGTLQKPGTSTTISGSQFLSTGINSLNLGFVIKTDASLTNKFEIEDIVLSFSNSPTVRISPDSKFVNRPALLLRAVGQDQVHTYRIPGLATTNKGTLIAVYDNRYLNSGDLQGDIDVGMSRSTDGGQTWSAMKKVLDMGDYGGLPQEQNGIGDPSVLVDQTTSTIWVAGLWVSGIPGQSAWNGSGPGLKPGETGQFVLTKSEDDGLSWSQPINITKQCKNPAWKLFFQGPGKGITLADGTLVFPAQFKDAQAVPWSTVICSKDHGKTWTVGTGAKSNTTESQVVQLADGSLMLNMRDDRNRTEKGDNNGRAVAVSKDLGQTWITHASSNSALQESNCMASLISTKILIGGTYKEVLFFSNPNVKTTRAHMTIKVSLDQGLTWPISYQAELNSADSFGYSCLTMVDEKNLGILYEGTRDLYFQKIPVADLIGNLSK